MLLFRDGLIAFALFFCDVNMFCLDPEKAGPAMIILPLQRAGGLRGPVWCRDGEAGNQIFVSHQHSCRKYGRADFGSESKSSPDQCRVAEQQCSSAQDKQVEVILHRHR